MPGRNKWHRHPKAVGPLEQPQEEATPLPPPEPEFAEGDSFQFHLAQNSQYIATGL